MYLRYLYLYVSAKTPTTITKHFLGLREGKMVNLAPDYYTATYGNGQFFILLAGLLILQDKQPAKRCAEDTDCLKIYGLHWSSEVQIKEGGCERGHRWEKGEQEGR